MHKLTTVVLTHSILFTIALNSALAVEETTTAAEPQEGLGIFVLILGVLAIFLISAVSLNQPNNES